MTKLEMSIVIPTYNRAGTILRAIKSALAASRPGDEIIVVDDGSKDNTEEVLAPYKEKIRYLRVPNGGAGKARNIGVDNATKPLIAFLDSDDEWVEGLTDLKRQFMEAHPEVLFSFSNFAIRTHAGAIHHNYLIHWSNDRRPWDEILGKGVLLSSAVPLSAGQPDMSVHIGDIFLPEMYANYILTSSLIVRRIEAGKACFFSEDLPIGEDWECFATLAEKGLVAYFDYETAWQLGDASDRVSDANELMRATAFIVIMQRVWGKSEAFLAKHQDKYEKQLEEVRLKKVRGLLTVGRTVEARMELGQLKHKPAVDNFLAHLPGVAVRSLVHVRTLIKLFAVLASSSVDSWF